ncbi:MAG: TetR/AcrR family transcriptional regulator C-terminal domain-containing protein [Chloroflexi bacterium]|nr:TetR/AcrR family transcriptional regulator C-terminal domain-containing protein [Chloroflexota bacterium]
MATRRYEQIADDIRSRIASSKVAPGEPVPSARAITREWGVAVATATRALASLRDEGLVQARPGVGTVVASRPSRTRSSRESANNEINTAAIVANAIAIADAEGLPAVSMRRIAIELGVPTMALYRHVRGKSSLLLLMADTILGQVRLPETPPPGWRAQLELVARLQWAGYREHPWLTRIISMTRPSVLPNGMLQTEWAVSALDGLGLDPNAMLHAAVNLFAYVRGSAMNIEMELESEQDTGLTDDEWLQSQRPLFARVLESGRYPQLARIIAASDVDLDLDTLFEFGLERLLDGYATLIESHG